LKNSQVEVSWEYPDSWSTPHSYFSLKFFVRIQRKKEKTKETEEECNQVGLNAARVGDNGKILTTRYLLQEQNCVQGSLCVSHTTHAKARRQPVLLSPRHRGRRSSGRLWLAQIHPPRAVAEPGPRVSLIEAKEVGPTTSIPPIQSTINPQLKLSMI